MAKKTAGTKVGAADRIGGISTEAVEQATGRGWTTWIRLLDRAGAKAMSHKQIVALVGREEDVNGWWQQMVTVGYEQARGLRDKHEKPSGYEISGSRTVNVPLSKLYRAWSDKRQRTRWLADPEFTVRTATKEKSMRITWADGASDVNVNFYGKGPGKSQVAVQHGKLTSPAAAERQKTYWREQLANLKQTLEG